jgi:hypothetical protein
MSCHFDGFWKQCVTDHERVLAIQKEIEGCSVEALLDTLDALAVQRNKLCSGRAHSVVAVLKEDHFSTAALDIIKLNEQVIKDYIYRLKDSNPPVLTPSELAIINIRL